MSLLIREVRKQRNMRLADLARAIGVSVPTMHRIEHNKTPITIDCLSKIAHALNVQIGAIWVISDAPHALTVPEETPVCP